MAKPNQKWPRILAMVLVAVVLTGTLSLILVEKFAPAQDYIPQGIVELPTRMVSAIMKPMQSAFAWATNGVKEYLDSWKLRKTIEIEYNRLKAQNDDLIYQALLNEELEAQVDRLKAQLGVFNENMDKNPVLANVTGKEIGNWFQMFEIDKGTDDGVKDNMAVINSQGLIGYVYRANKTASEVVSIIDSRAGVSGLISSSRAQGMVRGTLGADVEPTCRMYYLPVDLIPRPGDTVVTSGIGMPFPKGLKIGTVRESTRYSDENKQYVVIEPFVDFQQLEEVIVLVYDSPTEETPNANDGQLQYVPTPLDTFRPVPPIDDRQIEDPNLGAVTPPPRQIRDGSIEAENLPPVTPDPNWTLSPGATPTPNPELDALLREELEAEEDDLLDEEDGELDALTENVEGVVG